MGISGGGKRNEKEGWWGREAPTALSAGLQLPFSSQGTWGSGRGQNWASVTAFWISLLLTWADMRAQLREFSICIVFDLSFAIFFLML